MMHGRTAPLLVALLSLCLAAPVLGQDVERKMRIFDCEFLTAVRCDYPGPSMAAFGTFLRSEAPPMMEEDVEEAEMSADMLIDMITYNINPDSWDNSNNKIEFRDGKLIVIQTKDVLDEVASLLDALRTSQVRLVTVSGWALLVENTHLHDFLTKSTARATGSLLSQADFDYFLGKGVDPGAVKVLAAVTLTCFSGQRVHGGPLRKTRYVRDIDVEVAQKSQVIDPVMGTYTTGCLLDVRPDIVGANQSVLLDLSLAWAAVGDKGRTVDTGVGKVDTPLRELVSTRTTVLVPKGQAILFSATHPRMKGYSLAFVVRPRVMELSTGKGVGKKPAKARRVLRIYDVKLLTSRIKKFEGPDISMKVGEDSAMGGPAFDEEVDEGVGLSKEELVELIKTSIEEDTWSNVRNSITIVGSSLVVVQKPEVHEKIGAFLKLLWSRRAVLVYTVARYVSADHTTLKRIMTSGPAMQLPAKAMVDFEKEIRRGRGLKLLRSAAITSFNRQRVHLMTLRQLPVVTDTDVEVAEAAAIGDPIMGVVCGGLVFDYYPTLSGDGKHVAVDLVPQSATMSEPVLVNVGGGFKNNVQTVEVDYHHLNTSVTVPDGGTAAFVVGPDGSDPSRQVVLLVTTRIVRVK